MKRVLYALIAALLLTGQVFGPAVASPQAEYICKDSYVVRLGDSLGGIARRCQMTLAELLAANPPLNEASMIYPGQVLRIVPGAKDPAIPNSYTVQAGDTLSNIAERFDTTVKELIRVNPEILNPRLIYIDQVLRLPGDISEPRIALSADSVKPGWYLDVNVYGFPPNTDIDYRIGKVGGTYKTVRDAITDENGTSATYINFPISAIADEQWEIQVITTEISTGVQVISDPITISH